MNIGSLSERGGKLRCNAKHRNRECGGGWAREKISEFVNTIKNVEDTIQEARDTFSGMIQATDAIPSVERKFNQSKRFMSNETKIFVDNIEQPFLLW